MRRRLLERFHTLGVRLGVGPTVLTRSWCTASRSKTSSTLDALRDPAAVMVRGRLLARDSLKAMRARVKMLRAAP